MYIDRASEAELKNWRDQLEQEYEQFRQAGLNLDLTRGKPGPAQLDLSDALDGILDGQFKGASGDLRNYGGLDGIPEAKQLFADMLQVKPEEMLIGGNASLTLMYQAAAFALHQGVANAPAWREHGAVKFLCPSPGYDRHFSVCEHLGITMIPVAMTDAGPDMDEVERLVAEDHGIKGIWCVPRFSNPTGCVYSDEVVQRMAGLGKKAGAGFRIFWDNAYAVHELYEDAPPLASLMDACRAAGTEDSAYIFGSTSKVTYAGAGVSFMAASPANLKEFQRHLGMTTIGPDKVNQMRHVKFLRDMNGIRAHMRRHAEILRPRFEAVLNVLDEAFADSDLGQWTRPQGGYFISFDTRPGLASEVVRLAADAGVKLTPAGATYPYGRDPENRNIRLAPSFPSSADIEQAMKVFAACVKLASVRQKLGG